MKGVAAVVSVVGLLACTTQDTSRPTIDQLEEGLTLIDASDPTWGVTSAFKKGDRVIYLEQRIGAMKPQMYREIEPEDSTNEIDMRLIDQDGVTFFVQRGGDTYVDPTWDAEINHAFAQPPNKDRERDFELAREAAGALSQALPNKGFRDLEYHAKEYARRPLPSEDPNLAAKIAEIEAARSDVDVAYADWYGGSGSWWLQGDLYDKKICTVWVCYARHSGVAMFAYNGAWSLVVNSCNHGSCPGSTAVTYRCSSNSGVWRSNVTLTGESSSTTSVGGGCRSPYSWNSGGYNHSCNDDSAYELWQVKNGSSGHSGWYNTSGDAYSFVYTGAGTGGDGTWVNYACTCSNNNNCNNDWSRPICP